MNHPAVDHLPEQGLGPLRLEIADISQRCVGDDVLGQPFFAGNRFVGPTGAACCQDPDAHCQQRRPDSRPHLHVALPFVVVVKLARMIARICVGRRSVLEYTGLPGFACQKNGIRT